MPATNNKELSVMQNMSKMVKTFTRLKAIIEIIPEKKKLLRFDKNISGYIRNFQIG